MVLFTIQETNPPAAVPANGTFTSAAAATACSTGSLYGRRKFFGGAEVGVLEVIDRAIDVAAADRPQELWGTQPRLVSPGPPPRPPHPSGCERIDLRGATEADGCKSDAAKKSNQRASELSAGTFTQETRDEGRIVEEVMAFKAVLEGTHDQSDILVYELLKLLMQMQLSYQVLQETKIGFTVRAFRKSESKKIRSLVRKTILQWRTVVDKWLESTDALKVQNNHQFDPVSKQQPNIQSLHLDTSTKLPIDQNEGKDKNSEKIKDRPPRPPRPPVHRKPMPPQQKSLCIEQDSFKATLEIAKRKFDELYRENGKRMRTK